MIDMWSRMATGRPDPASNDVSHYNVGTTIEPDILAICT
jgi:hypothetical protein